MAIIGFNFTQIAAKRFVSNMNKVQVNNNVAVRDIVDNKMSGDPKRKTVRVSFKFDTLYEPKTARMLMEGDIVLLLDAKEADALVKGWQEKKVPTKSLLDAMNHVLERCNVQAIILARDLGLPSPMPMPKVNAQSIEAKNLPKKVAAKKSAKKTAKKK